MTVSSGSHETRTPTPVLFGIEVTLEFLDTHYWNLIELFLLYQESL